jgi:hypothetical protein
LALCTLPYWRLVSPERHACSASGVDAPLANLDQEDFPWVNIVSINKAAIKRAANSLVSKSRKTKIKSRASKVATSICVKSNAKAATNRGAKSIKISADQKFGSLARRLSLWPKESA